MKLAELADADNMNSSLLAQPVIESLDNMTRYCAMIAASRLMACAEGGFGRVLDSKSIIDFGTGSGASAFSLGLLAEESKGSVDSLEMDTSLQRTEKIRRSGLTEHPRVRLHTVDGLEWISDKAQEGKRYDLIAGCWFGPDYTGDLAKGLISASRQALASHGLLMIYSDDATMESVQNACSQESVFGHLIKGRPDGRIYEPDICVIPRWSQQW